MMVLYDGILWWYINYSMVVLYGGLWRASLDLDSPVKADSPIKTCHEGVFMHHEKMVGT